MNARERIEEAHGLWELAIVRLAAFAETSARLEVLQAAISAERDAFNHWKLVSSQACLATDDAVEP